MQEVHQGVVGEVVGCTYKGQGPMVGLKPRGHWAGCESSEPLKGTVYKGTLECTLSGIICQSV